MMNGLKCELCGSEDWIELGEDDVGNVIFECEGGHVIYEYGSEVVED